MDMPAVDRVRDRCRAHPRVLPGASGSAQELSKPVQGLLGHGAGGTAPVPSPWAHTRPGPRLQRAAACTARSLGSQASSWGFGVLTLHMGTAFGALGF